MLGLDGGILARAGMQSFAIAVAALAIGLAVKSAGSDGIGLAGAAFPAGPARLSVFGTIHPKIFALPAVVGSQVPDGPGVRVASLATGVASDVATDDEARRSEPVGSVQASASFAERFFFDQRLASFDERFPAGIAPSRARAFAAVTDERATTALLPAPQPERPAASAVVRLPPPKPVRLASLAGANISEKQLTADAQTESNPLSDADSRTAIYDITARTVYLPDGRRLVAHSGLGGDMDDPSQVHLKSRGPTPPNVYRLAMRERLFHGVRAIRLIPADETRMYGREGMLAHTYMLGPNGQSNGCVSFEDYPAFLNAFLNGEVDRLVVVEHLESAPSPKTGSDTAAFEWLPKAIKGLFGRS